ncbi:MAG: DUF1553 domain-containing protein [Verrucomicrobiota bacterium]|nr:DUF1553 domain-containing protein [Verrucomicrobiota bacterium]
MQDKTMQPVSRQMPARILVSRNACHDGHSRGHIFHGGLAGATLIWFLTLLHTQADDTYKTLVQPILDSACVECHGAETQKGGLRLDSLEQLALGGSSGPVVLPGTQGQGTLLERLRHADPEERMPPAKKPPLAVDKIALIAEWVAQGAAELVRLKKVPFPQEAYAHWSLRPLSKPAVPRDSHDAAQAWIRNPVDSFIHAKLVEQKLSPSAEADRRTLIRRLYYDLTGLPPTPEAIEDFENSQRPDAYEQLVEQLLGSEAYGERWARHWLDVVHYADTHGYDKDKLRPHAWPYRDYVIRALNEDKPYGRFVEEQLAGDVLYPGTMDGLTATGFIAAGPWDFIGHAEVPESKLDGRIARHLDRDDMVSTTMNTFVSTTVQCARCHRHKFDPVRMEDYYGLQAVFAALDRADRSFDADPEVAARRLRWTGQKDATDAEIKDLNARIEDAAGPALEALNHSLQALESSTETKPAAYGYHSAIASSVDTLKWVQVDLGASHDMREIVLAGCDDAFNGIGAGFGFPVRFRIETSDDASFENGVVMLVDHSLENFANPGVEPVRFDVKGHSARHIRVTATRLALRAEDYILALAELQVLDGEGQNVALKSKVLAKDSIEAPVRWARSNLVDGHDAMVEARDAQGRSQVQLRKERDDLLRKATTEPWAARLESLEKKGHTLQSNLEALPPQMKVYAGTIHKGGGAFRGTGHEGGQPRSIHVLARGDMSQPRQEVGPGAIPVIHGRDPKFELPPSHVEGDRRVALAKWILQKDHPLTWRSIVNRVWQYHFGRGICDTPNDFGHMGGEPSHADLLDWLAVSFRDSGQSLKQLHRLMVTSATYRQVSEVHPDKAALDQGNRYLWRMHRRRLEAEALRDSVLHLAGCLDRKMGGSAFMDFVIEKPEHSPHYEYHLHDPMDRKSHRRSVYRFIVRSQQQPFMTTLDCADPSLRVGRRNETLTPNQSLALLNNKFMVSMAEQWAMRLADQNDLLEDSIYQGLEEAACRKPSPEEWKRWTDYARQHGLANACRWMFNMNAFMFVD